MKGIWQSEHEATAFGYARRITAQYAKSFYLAARFLPLRKRWATYALYGFCRYADNLIDKPRPRQDNELLNEIDYLAAEIEIAYRSGESEHPVILPFIKVALAYNIPIEYPLDLLQGVKMDIQNKRYKNFDDLYLFCYRVAGVVGLMMTHLLGYRQAEAFPYAEKLGIAMQLTNILRDIREDKNMGRIYLPQDEIQQFGVSEKDFFEERFSTSFQNLMIHQIQRAQDYYQQADQGIKLLDSDARFAIYAASRIYQKILFGIQARQCNPFLGRVTVPSYEKIAILMHQLLQSKWKW